MMMTSGERRAPSLRVAMAMIAVLILVVVIVIVQTRLALERRCAGHCAWPAIP